MSHRVADAYMRKLEDESEMWGVWCIRSGGEFGPAETWMKQDGARWMGSEGEAIAKARDTQESSNKTFATAGRRNPLAYEARSL